VLVRQFRYPVYASVAPGERLRKAATEAWMLEIIAGVEEEGQTPAEVVRREACEEAGYEIRGELDPVAHVFVSPGASSEQVSIFLGHIDSGRRTGPGGGLAEEGEDTQVVVLPRVEALAMLRRGEIADAKTVIALQHLAAQQR
jgi:nudix-type nucleoside diphosphatase (YffH/AdpP family)